MSSFKKSMSDHAQKEFADALSEAESMLDKLPKVLGERLKKEIHELRTLIVEHRHPRFALVGRRGSGKSSLINAIFGEKVSEVGHEKSMTGRGVWREYVGQLGTIDLLDTRGLQEGSSPDEDDAAETPEASVAKAIREKGPDAFLFIVKATEVDAAIDGDLDGLVHAMKEAKNAHGYVPPVFGVLTHCDQVEPQDVYLHIDEADEDERKEKLERIRRIEHQLDAKLHARAEIRDHVISVMGVSAYQSWKADGTLRSDRRWRIEQLVTTLEEEIPNEAKVELARMAQIRHLQRKVSGRVAQSCAVVCGGIAATPVPVADIGPITAVQVGMVTAIAYIAGRRMSLEAAGEFLAALGINVGAGFAFRELARGLVKMIPVAGNAVSAAVSYGATLGLGKTAIAHYVEDLPREQLQAYLKEQRQQAEASYVAPMAPAA